MPTLKSNYFQYRKSHDYPIYVRMTEEETQSRFTHLLQEFGFSLLTEAETKKIALNRPQLRILNVQPASSRLQLQINGSDLLDKYGQESLSLQGGIPVYTYRRVGLMAVPHPKSIWELAIHQEISSTEQMVGLRIILVRFLSQSLAEAGVLAFWGTVKDDAVLIMKQHQSFGEAVVIDLQKRMIFSNGGEVKLGSSLKIIRNDKTVSGHVPMSREDLISFLSVNTCLLSFSGITPSMKKSIYDLSARTAATYAQAEAPANL